MKTTRREFVSTGLAGTAGVYAHRIAMRSSTAATTQPAATAAEDGYQLWLRYAPPSEEVRRRYFMRFTTVVVEGTSPTAGIIREEMGAAVSAIVGSPMTYDGPVQRRRRCRHSDKLRDHPGSRLGGGTRKGGPEGYVIRTALVAQAPGIAIASQGEIGALYGAFHLLRLMQTGQPIDRLDITERPKVQLRLLNHWDNLDGSIERGYAGRSLWQWDELPGTISPRYVDYARANASIGINGAVINNVNANVRILSPEYLRQGGGAGGRVAAVRRARVSVGQLRRADAARRPDDRRSARSGRRRVVESKADEIYALIPDFGGFLVKANSEGQPGPKDYGRNHAEGANVLADALAPHGGNVIWRAFIYDEDVDPDRAKRAYIEFTKLDGQFRPNVLVQVKNGADRLHAARAVPSAVRRARRRRRSLAEIQATQEYLGQAKHLVYLGTMWKEFLDADTFAKGKGSTVGKVIEGAVHP